MTLLPTGFRRSPQRQSSQTTAIMRREFLQNGCQWLVTDRVLPPWPGLDNFLSLRTTHPKLRIAFIENGNLDDRILARVTGASVLLPRPLSRKTVRDALTLTSAT